MPCGLYGKLPAKRDFIAVSTPRAFLAAWEPWIQGGLSASRASLGPDWQAIYLRAPIWRFWLGADLCGEAIVGAFMPSVDGVGRYFPLTLIGRAQDAAGVPPPEIEPFEAWFGLAETFLLSTLTETGAFEAILAEAGRLPDPIRAALPASASDVERLRDGTLVASAEPSHSAESSLFTEGLARLRLLDHARVHAGMTYWWTAGGEGFSPRVAASRGMPHPYAFAGMLTGRFDATGP